MDLVIVMQDWDFPHFTNTLDVNLPGLHKHIFNFQAVEVQISGKWCNYGIIFLVMIFDLNMWKNQIFYYPEKYGQYIGKCYLQLKKKWLCQANFYSCLSLFFFQTLATERRVFTVTDERILMTNNASLWTYEARSQINPDTHLPYINGKSYHTDYFEIMHYNVSNLSKFESD